MTKGEILVPWKSVTTLFDLKGPGYHPESRGGQRQWHPKLQSKNNLYDANESQNPGMRAGCFLNYLKHKNRTTFGR